MYCTASGVKIFLNDERHNSENFPSDNEIEQFIVMNDGIIDKMCDRTFASASGVEYYDTNSNQNELILNHYPILTITSVEELQSDFSYSTMTETYNTDTASSYYVKESDTGIIKLNDPISDENAYRVTYTWGYTTTPSWVEKLSLLMTARDVLHRISSSVASTDLKREYVRHIDTINKEINLLSMYIDKEYNYGSRWL